MATQNTCTSCGAPNSLLDTQCIYCKAQLNAFEEDQISNQEVISEANKWIGAFSSTVLNDPVIMKYDGKVVRIEYADAVSRAKRYLGILQYRAIDDPKLLTVYQEIKAEFEKKSQKLKNFGSN